MFQPCEKPQSVLAITFSRPSALGVQLDAPRDELGVLDHVADVPNDARQQHLALGQLHVVPDQHLVHVPVVRAFDRVALRADLQNRVEDRLQRHVGRVRRVPATPADVQPRALLGNALQRMIDGLDLEREPLQILVGVVRIVEVRELRRIDLDVEAGRDDGFVLLVHRLGEREQVLLLGLVVLVDARAERAQRRRRHGHERAFHVDAGERRFQSCELGIELVHTLVGDRPRAHRQVGRRPDGRVGLDLRRQPHGRLDRRPRLVEVRELLALACDGSVHLVARQTRVQPEERLLVLAHLEAAQAVAHVAQERVLAELAVVDDVDAGFGLLAHDIADGACRAVPMPHARRTAGAGPSRS